MFLNHLITHQNNDPKFIPIWWPSFSWCSPNLCPWEFPILSDSLIFIHCSYVNRGNAPTCLHNQAKTIVTPRFCMGKTTVFRTTFDGFRSSFARVPGLPLRGDRGDRVAVRVAARASRVSRVSRCPEVWDSTSWLIYIYMFPWVIIIPNFGKPLYSPWFTHHPG